MRTPTTQALRRSVLVGLLLAGLAHLAPLHLVQKLDGVLFDAYAGRLDAAGERDITVVPVGELDLLAGLPVGANVTVVGPSLIAVGAVENSVSGETAAWLFALISVFSLLRLGAGHRRYAVLIGAAGPVLLLAGSGVAFTSAGAWIPVAGPALLMLLTGALTVAALQRRVRAPVPADEAGPDLPGHDAVVDAWQAQRDVAATADRLPDLYELGRRLNDEGYPALAAHTYFRIAQVQPDFRDVTRRLVRAGRSPAERDAIDRLQDEMPERLGRYRLLEPIGRGTTGRVFLAQDPLINRLVALKLIDLTFERDADEVVDAVERFRREAETTGRLSHPNIVTIHDMDESDGRAYIAMEYLQGDLLSRFTSPETLLPASLIVELGALTADALDYAHARNVIHRDIKPGNIMYDSVGGDLKITDFGIARLIDVNRTRTGVVLGTPSFMAPEQIEGGNVKAYTDLFALGVSLYELLTGQLPFRENSMTQLMFVIANEPHEPVSAIRPELPPEIDAVLDRALKKDPDERFRRGRDMADALRATVPLMA